MGPDLVPRMEQRTCARNRESAGNARAAILLEIVLSIAILALGIAAIGGQISQAFKSSQRTDRVARAVMLAESLVAELDAGLILPEQEQDGDFTPFGKHYDAWRWRMLIDPTREEGMFLVTVEVYYGDPNLTSDSLDDKEKVYSAYLLRAEPGTVNLVEELGLAQEELQNLSDLLDIPGVDLGDDLNPAALAQLDFELLAEILPLLPPELMTMIGASSGSLMELAQRLGSATGSGSSGGNQSGSGGLDVEDLTPEEQEELEQALENGEDPLQIFERLQEIQSNRSRSGGSPSRGGRGRR